MINMHPFIMKVCQTLSDPPDEHNIADPGTEEMWIESDGTPYAYYKGRDDRYYNKSQLTCINPM